MKRMSSKSGSPIPLRLLISSTQFSRNKTPFLNSPYRYTLLYQRLIWPAHPFPSNLRMLAQPRDHHRTQSLMGRISSSSYMGTSSDSVHLSEPDGNSSTKRRSSSSFYAIWRACCLSTTATPPMDLHFGVTQCGSIRMKGHSRQAITLSTVYPNPCRHLYLQSFQSYPHHQIPAARPN